MQKKYSGIILISDLDDTLLNKRKEVSVEDMESINDFIEKGGSFTVATGRVYESAMPYIRKLNITHPCIMYNGGMIYDTKNEKVLWKCSLPDVAKTCVIETLENFPELGVEILIGKDIYVPKFNNILEDKMKIEHVDFISCTMDDIPGDWLKVLFTLEHSLVHKVEQYVKSRNYKGLSFVESCGCYYEMLSEGVSKGSTISKMLEMSGCAGMKIVAVGDYNNDIEMVKMADIGACVADASDDLKQAADIVLKNTSEYNAITELIAYVKNNLEG